jgi:hypothetical protein
MAEIKSESVAGFIPESVAGLLRNQQKFQNRFGHRVGLTVSFRDVTTTPFRNKTFALAPRQRFHNVQFLEIGEMVDGGPPMPLMPGEASVATS